MRFESQGRVTGRVFERPAFKRPAFKSRALSRSRRQSPVTLSGLHILGDAPITTFWATRRSESETVKSWLGQTGPIQQTLSRVFISFLLCTPYKGLWL